MENKGMPDSVKTTIYWALGVGIIALILLVLGILFGNLYGNVGFGQDTTSYINETITLQTTGDTPTGATGRVNGVITVSSIVNRTGGELLSSANYTVSGVVITGVAASEFIDTAVNVSYSVAYDEQGKIDTDNIITNYTKSATNTSTQFPVVGTIIGVALLLTILIGVLVLAIKKMMGVANSAGGSSGGRFDRTGIA